MMRSLVATLLLTIALVSAKTVEDQPLSNTTNATQTQFEEATQLQGERCGNHHTCATGLECVQTGLVKRCIPQRACLAQELKTFQEEFNSEEFKADILKEAEVTQSEIVQAAVDVLGVDNVDGPKNGTVFQNSVIKKLIRAVNNHAENFARFGDIVDHCSTEADDETPEPIISTMSRQGSAPAPAPTVLIPEQPRTMVPSSSPSNAPSAHPTRNPTRTTFVGFHIEAGALVEASISVFWKNYDPDFDQTIYAKGCVGAGPLIGADISFIAIIAETPDVEDIEGLSAQYGVDIGAGFSAGYDLGVSLLSEPPYVYNQVTFGGGIGVGASAFSMCNGIDTGLTVDIFGAAASDSASMDGDEEGDDFL